jgi:hypothetical protein
LTSSGALLPRRQPPPSTSPRWWPAQADGQKPASRASAPSFPRKRFWKICRSPQTGPKSPDPTEREARVFLQG